MDTAGYSPYGAAFQESFYATPTYFNGEYHNQPEMAWNQQSRWLPVGRLYSQHQQPSPELVVDVPHMNTAAASVAECHDSTDNRPHRMQGEGTEVLQTPLSSIGTLEGPSGSSSASFTFWSPYSTLDETNSSTSSTNSLQTAATSTAVSDAQLITESERERRCKSADGAATFPWATCVPMVGMTSLAALLFLFVIATAVRSQRLMLQLPVTLYVDEGILQNSWSRAANVGDVLVYPEGRPLNGVDTEMSEVTFSDLSKSSAQRTRQMTSNQDRNRLSVSGSARKEVTTPAITRVTLKVLPRRTSKRFVLGHRMKKSTRKLPSSGEYGNRDEEEEALVFPYQRPIRPMCGPVFYTFCERPPLEFHYRRAANACVPTSDADSADICNRGGNRFASLDHCLDSCVAPDRPAKECFDRPLFTRCARQDSLSSWWHYNGRKCVPWPFPSGGCPGNGSIVFRTGEACRKRCEDRQHGPRCRRPEVVACGRNHLKYPYFAYRDPKEERVRCLRSSMAMLRGHRCLAGANRFHSHGACVSSCRKRPRLLG